MSSRNSGLQAELSSRKVGRITVSTVLYLQSPNRAAIVKWAQSLQDKDEL